jgi:hypothetical protein
MDVVELSLEKAQFMMPFLRAMLRNTERGLAANQKHLDNFPNDCQKMDNVDEVISSNASEKEDRAYTESNDDSDSTFDSISVASSETTFEGSTSGTSITTNDSLLETIYSMEDFYEVLS